MERPRALIVYNPTRVNVERLRRTLRRVETLAEWSPSTWLATEPAESAEELRRRIPASLPDLVIAAGGDGTVNAVAEALWSQEVPLGILPLGTTNLLARNLGIPLMDPAAAMRIALTGEERRIDVGVVAAQLEDGHRITRHFLVMAGFGVDAQMVVHTTRSRKDSFGWLAYVNGVARGLTRKGRFDVSYRLDGTQSYGNRIHTMVIGNGGLLPAGLRLIPYAVVDDGELDVLILRPRGIRGWSEVAGWFLWENNLVAHLRRRKGRQRSMPDPGSVHQSRARELTLELEEAEDFEIDGEYIGKVIALRITVQPRSLPLRVEARRSHTPPVP